MSTNSNSLTAYDVAIVGSRLAAILIGGRLLAALPQVPFDISRLKESDAFSSSLKLGTSFHLILIPLLGVACLVLWYKADVVARSIVRGIRPLRMSGAVDQDIIGAFVVLAGWIMLMYSMEGLASFVSQGFAKGSLQSLQDHIGVLFVFIVGLFLVAGRRFFVQLWGGPGSHESIDEEPASSTAP